MAILKVGLGRQSAVSGTVQGVEIDETGKFGPQYKVTFTTGDLLFINKDPFERQTARMEKLPNELEGQTLTFWRKPMADDPSGTKGFWNIEVGGGGVSVAGAARADDVQGRDLRALGIPLAATSFEQIKDQYVETLGVAVAILDDAAETLGTAFTAAEVTAVAALLYIERRKRGV